MRRFLCSTCNLVIHVIAFSLTICLSQLLNADEPSANNVLSTADWSLMAEKLQMYASKGVSSVGASSQSASAQQVGDSLVRLDFENAPLRDLVHAVLHDTLGAPYAARTSVDGFVTVKSVKPIDSRQALAVLETILGLRWMTLKRSTDGVYYLDNRPLESPRLGQPDMPIEGGDLIVIPLDFISPSSVAHLLLEFTDNHSAVIPLDSFGVILLSGRTTQLAAWRSMIAAFDTDYLSTISVGVFPVEGDDLDAVIKRLEFTLDAGRSFTGDPQSKQATRYIPLDWMSSILVVSHNGQSLDAIGKIIHIINPVSLTETEEGIYLYPLIHADSHYVADKIEELYNNHDVRISASEGNAVVVHSSYKDFLRLSKTLKLIDMPVRQIRVKVSFYEVSLVGELQHGIQWIVRGSLGGGREETVRWLTGGSLDQPDANGFFYGIRDSTDRVTALVQALSQESSVILRSNPSLLVQNAHTGVVRVGEEVATLKSATILDRGQGQEPSDLDEIRDYDRWDTGLTLSVNARVGADDLVVLALELNLTELGPLENLGRGLDAYVFYERAVETNVALHGGESLIFGGLVRENRASSRAQVPLLGRIPGLSYLLGSSRFTNRRTELFMVITPEIVESRGVTR